MVYTNEMKLRLINLLEKYIGKESIIESKEHGNFQNDYKINKSKLFEYFSDNKDIARAHNTVPIPDSKIMNYNWKNKSHIYLDEFIDFLTSGELNSKSDTKGLYHKYMDCLLVLYNVEIVKGNNFPNFEKLSKKDREIVEPKRFEYKVIWWLIHKIKTHQFLHKHENKLGITFQKPIRNGDKKFYDLLFNNINLIIEVQEKGRAHDENENDLTKEGMVALRGKRIVYLKMDGFDDREGYKEYLDSVWYGVKYNRKPNNLISEPIEIIGLEKILIQGLVSYDYENKEGILSDYILYEFDSRRNNLIKFLELNIKQYDNLSKSLRNLYKKKYEIDQQKLLELNSANKDNSTYISTIFKYYHKSYQNCDEYIINPVSENFTRIFFGGLTLEKIHEIILLCIDYGFCGIKGNTVCSNGYKKFAIEDIRFSWNGLNKIFLNPEENKIIIEKMIGLDNAVITYSRWMLELLQTVEKSHKDIIRFISEHNKACYKNISTLWDKNEKYIKDETYNFYLKKISELENTIKDLKDTLVYNDEKTTIILKKTSVLFNRVDKYKEKRTLTKELHEILEEILACAKELKEYRKLKMSNCTVQFIESESIIKEKLDFPIKYTGLESDSLNVIKFEKECVDWGIPNEKIKYIKEALNCSIKSGVIYKLVINNTNDKVKKNKVKNTIKNLYYNEESDESDESDEESIYTNGDLDNLESDSESDLESQLNNSTKESNKNTKSLITKNFDPLNKNNIFLTKIK